MQSIQSDLGPVRYNAAEEAFEAIVTFETPNGTIRRPAQYFAPLTSPDALVRRGLLAAASIADAENTGLKSMCYASDMDGTSGRSEDRFGLIEKTREIFAFVRNKAA